MRSQMIILLIIMLTCSACSSLNSPETKPLPTETPMQETALPQLSNEDANLQNEINTAINRFEGNAGIYAQNLNTGKSLGVNDDNIFPTASTHKLVVALAVYKYLYRDASPEKKKDYDENIKAMMVVSDNPAYFELLDEIESSKPEVLAKVLEDLQLKKTRIHSREAFSRYGYHSVTSPFEMAAVFKAINDEDYLGKEMSSILKEELAHTIFKDEIPRFMQSAKVLHKNGELPGILCDVGIVDDGRDVILISAFTSTKKAGPYASDFIADLSAKSYNALRSK